MTRRPIALAAIVLIATACGAPQLAAPPEITAPPTTAAPDEGFPTCTEEERTTEDATRSYAPDGALPTPGDMPAGSTMAEIQERGRLIVGVSADTLQFGALDATGTPEGFDIDILKEVAQAIFGEGGEDRIEYQVMNYAGRLPSLEADEVDLVAHTMTINCDRWERIAFSSTYYDAGQKVLVRTGSGYESVDDLVVDGATVCVPGGSTNLEEIEQDEYTAPEDGGSGIELLVQPDVTDCLVAVQQGRAAAITGDDTVLVGLAAQDPNLEVVGDTFTEEPYGIGVRAGEVDLVRFVNAVLEDVRTSGRWGQIYTEWVSGDPTVAPPAPPEPVYGR